MEIRVFFDEDDRTKKTVVYKADHIAQRQIEGTTRGPHRNTDDGC